VAPFYWGRFFSGRQVKIFVEMPVLRRNIQAKPIVCSGKSTIRCNAATHLTQAHAMVTFLRSFEASSHPRSSKNGGLE
jgi:hypothetical protein